MRGYNNKSKMKQDKYIIKHIDNISPTITSHLTGKKFILSGNDQPRTPITQIAYTVLEKGESIDTHSHPTMDEHFIITEGCATFVIDDEELTCNKGSYILVRAGIDHAITVHSDLHLITIGIAL